jgi:valyl-tRNA synthetase
MASYRLSETLMAIYRLFWDDFCSWYLEMIKPAYKQPIDRPTLQVTEDFFDRLIRVIHPFLPFITEEIWQLLKERNEGDSVMVNQMPDAGYRPDSYREPDTGLLKAFGYAKEVIMAIRNARKEKNIPQKEAIRLMIRKNNDEPADPTFDELVKKLCGIEELTYVEEKQPDAVSFVTGTTEFYIPLSTHIDPAEEIKKLNDELAYARGFLATVEKKLSNERFVQNAPENIVANEKKKKIDAEAKIRVLEEKLKGLE